MIFKTDHSIQFLNFRNAFEEHQITTLFCKYRV